MRKDEVLKIIDEVMNNREIDSIRNAILAIRDKVIEADEDNVYTANCIYKIRLRGGHPCVTFPYFDKAKYICIDPCEKIDTGRYGAIWYE